jgi:tetratricopeptide (TPR) repeat protein
LRSEIIGRLARTINFKLVETEGLIIERERARNPNSHDLLIQGWAALVRPISAATLQEARRIFERVLEIDAGSVAAKVGLAHALSANIADGWSTSVPEDEARAERLLLEAIACDANSVRARAALGLLRWLQNRLDESRIELETAIALLPNYAPACCQLGMTLICLGQPEAAIPVIGRAYGSAHTIQVRRVRTAC